jgi:hypothetical protein
LTTDYYVFIVSYVPESPTQSLIIRLPADKARRIVRIVDLPDSAYESVDEFIRVAVENQLTMEGELESHQASDPSVEHRVESPAAVSAEAVRMATAVPAAPRKPKRSPSPAASTPQGNAEALLRRPAVEGMSLHEAMPTPGFALSAFTNRLTPLLAGPRALGNLWANGAVPALDAYLDLTARASRALGLRLRTEDDAAGRRGRYRRSTAWPVGDDESKSLIRYRNCFMFVPEKKGGFTGPLLELGLIAISGSKVFLTQRGAEFASAASPAIDDADGVDLLSDEHRKILSEAIIRIPGEFAEIKQFLEAMKNVSGSQDEMDKELGVVHKGWSEAQVVSHRAAMVGRLRDLLVIDVEPLPSAKSQLVPGANFETFVHLVHNPDQQEAGL